MLCCTTSRDQTEDDSWNSDEPEDTLSLDAIDAYRYAQADPDTDFYNRLTSFDSTPVFSPEPKTLKGILSKGGTKTTLSLASSHQGTRVDFNEEETIIPEVVKPPVKQISTKALFTSAKNKVNSSAMLTKLSSAKGNMFSFFKKSSTSNAMDQKHDLLAHFNSMDSDGSGFVDQLELSHYLLDQFGLEAGNNMKSFVACVKYYIHEFNASHEKPGELNRREFIHFFTEFRKLFYKVDANSDGTITVEELMDYLNEEADRLNRETITLRQRALTIIPEDKTELTMIDVFSILPELNELVHELPQKKIELDAFSEFIYRQFTNDDISKMFNKIDRDDDQLVYPKDLVYFFIKKFKLKTMDNMKHKWRKMINQLLTEINIDDGKLTEQSFLRFWYYFTSIVYNIAPERTNTIKQSQIVFFFEQRGAKFAQDIVKNVLKMRQLGHEISLVQFYSIYPLLVEGMKGKRHKTTVSIWSDEDEDRNMLYNFLGLFNRRGKYKEKHARRTLKEYYHEIKGKDRHLTSNTWAEYMVKQQAPTDMFEQYDYERAIDQYIELYEIDAQVLDEDFISFWIFFFTAYRNIDQNGDGEIGRLQLVKYVERETQMDKPEFIRKVF